MKERLEMGAFMIGPFMIKYEWIILIISGIFAYLIMRFKTNDDRPFQEFFLNSILNAVLIGIITYKFSSVIFQPSIVFDNPLSILYKTGGMKGKFLGIIMAFFYLIIKYRKEHWPIKMWLTQIVYGIVTFFIAFWLFRTLFFLLV